MASKVGSKSKTQGKHKVRVAVDRDIVHIAWSVATVADCLGFSVHREIKGKMPQALPAWVPLEPNGAVQSLEWRDTLAPRRAEFRYLVFAVRGTRQNPERDERPLFVTRFVSIDTPSSRTRVETGNACSQAA